MRIFAVSHYILQRVSIRRVDTRHAVYACLPACEVHTHNHVVAPRLVAIVRECIAWVSRCTKEFRIPREKRVVFSLHGARHVSRALAEEYCIHSSKVVSLFAMHYYLYIRFVSSFSYLDILRNS